MYTIFICFKLLSSPYLLVCGDDRVRDRREQMMLMQVVLVLVRLSQGAGISWDFHVYVLYLWICDKF